MPTVSRKRPTRGPTKHPRAVSRDRVRPPAITVRGLVKAFGGTRAVDGLSFTVPTGKVTGFLGPNGAGKTTTIRAILGLGHPDAGETSVFGKRYGDIDNPLSRIGVLIDGSAFHPARKARAHLLAVATAIGAPNDRVAQVLREVALEGAADRKVGEFSLGMKQRLGLATALLGDPDLLILDEPANGLDPAGIRWLRAYLRAFAESGRTVFVSSHVLAEMAQLADEVVVINRGRLIRHTTVAELTAPTSVFVRTPDAKKLVKAIARAGGSVDAGDDGLAVSGLAADEVGEIAAREKVVLHQLTPRTHSLEDVFLQLTTSEGDN